MKKHKLIFVSSIANSFEWYDYALFGHFAPIISQKFFPDHNPKIALLNTFLVFAVGYLMRPIGGIFFGLIGDKFGRKNALSLAMLCMAFPTAAIGLLPTYQSIGINATIAMVIVRMLQGLSMGGVLTGSISFVVEHTQKNERGFTSSFSMASICIGILLGSIASYATQTLLSVKQFSDWGWRLPFIAGVFIFFVGVYIKKRMAETPIFLKNKREDDLEINPLSTTFREHWKNLIITIFINGTGSVIFYIEAIYLVSYLKIYRNFDETSVNHLINACYVLMGFVTILAGWMSDKIGRRRIFVINLIIIILMSFFLLEIFEWGSFAEVIGAQIILAILAALYIGAEPALQAELYPPVVRNTALSISYNAATSIFGGTAPFFMELLVQKGNLSSGAYYIIAAAICSLIALYFYVDRSQVTSSQPIA